jgi:hypothetical protein
MIDLVSFWSHVFSPFRVFSVNTSLPIWALARESHAALAAVDETLSNIITYYANMRSVNIV